MAELVLSARRRTDLDERIPTEVLYRLPEWCFYIWAPDLMPKVDDDFKPSLGFFVFLDWGRRDDGSSDLWFLLDKPDRGLLPLPFELRYPSMTDAVDGIYEQLGSWPGWVDDVSKDYAIHFLRENKGRPFVLAIGFKTCHGPFGPPPRRDEVVFA